MIQKTLAIVLKVKEFREKSQLITLYTEKFGKINAVAKGLRQKRGRGIGGLVQFSENEIVLYKKRSGLHLIDKWNLENQHQHLYRDLKKLLVASVMAEMVSSYVEGEHPNLPLYKLLKASLNLLAKDSEELFLAAFTSHFLDCLGYRPHLERCLRCQSKEISEPLLFSLNKGSIICAQCRRNADTVVTLNKEMKGILEYLQNSALESSIRLKVAPFVPKKLYEFLILFLTYTLGKEIKSVSLLETAVA